MVEIKNTKIHISQHESFAVIIKKLKLQEIMSIVYMYDTRYNNYENIISFLLSRIKILNGMCDHKS